MLLVSLMIVPLFRFLINTTTLPPLPPMQNRENLYVLFLVEILFCLLILCCVKAIRKH